MSIQAKIGLSTIAALAIFGATACAAERQTYVPTPHPGAPAYWESNLADEPARTKVPEVEPAAEGRAVDATEDPEASRPVQEKFLWDDGRLGGSTPPASPASPASPPSQVPLKDAMPPAKTPAPAGDDTVYDEASPAKAPPR